MIRVRFEEIAPCGGFERDVEMHAAPRLEENVDVDGQSAFTVKSVTWVMNDPRYDVLVRIHR
jgi:hypothetical protein